MPTQSLTSMQRKALLRSGINLSDGHARQTVGEATRAELLETVCAAMDSGAPASYREAEERFLRNLSHYTGQVYSEGSSFTTYASSVAMSVVANYLRGKGHRVGVLCPTFDNIPGLLRVAGVSPLPVSEQLLTPDPQFDGLDRLELKSLIIVNPNNPTGRVIPRKTLCAIFDWAARTGVEVVLDLAFRWFDAGSRWDMIAEAEQRGAKAITIDDTGKILSLLDTKASVLSATSGIRDDLRKIHEEYVLNISELSLRMLSVMLDWSRPDNEISRAWQIVRVNREYLRRCVIDRGLTSEVTYLTPNSALSVEWISHSRSRDLVHELRRRGLAVLDAAPFRWSSRGEPAAHEIRLALMRDSDYFSQGAEIFARTLAESVSTHYARVDRRTDYHASL